MLIFYFLYNQLAFIYDIHHSTPSMGPFSDVAVRVKHSYVCYDPIMAPDNSLEGKPMRRTSKWDGTSADENQSTFVDSQSNENMTISSP